MKQASLVLGPPTPPSDLSAWQECRDLKDKILTLRRDNADYHKRVLTPLLKRLRELYRPYHRRRLEADRLQERLLIKIP